MASEYAALKTSNSNGDSTRLPFTLACALFALALLISLCFLGISAPKASAITIADTAQTLGYGQWTKKSGCEYYVTGSGKAKGLSNIGGKCYLFSSKGVQKTGWRLVNGSYCFFKIANGSKGSLVTNKVVNGISIQRSGAALVNKTSLKELKLLVAAQKRVDSVAKPGASTSSKLKASYKWVWKKCRECSSSPWSTAQSRIRKFAWDIIKRHAGSCDSMACGYAYLANACGAKSVKIAASGGHTWAVVYGKVCDVEMAKQSGGWHYYMLPYAGSFYNHADRYKVTIAPRTKPWSKAKAIKKYDLASNVTGWVTQNGTSYYYRNGKKLAKSWLSLGSKKYYLKANGRVAVGSFKVKGTYYVFNAAGILQTGSKVRNVKIQGTTYRVSKSGKAKSGWSKNGKYCYAKNGELLTGVCWYKNKLWAFGSKGLYKEALTKKLQSAYAENKPAAPLLSLMGAYEKRAVTESCRFLPNSGKEITYTFAHVIVRTYCEDGGMECISYAEAR